MSETLVSTTLDSEFREDETRPNTNERKYPEEEIPWWYRPTYDLVMANLEVVGPCQWMGGEKVRLGTAMWKLTRPTQENVHIFHANVVEFLADAAKEQEEEKKPDEDEPEQVPDQSQVDNQEEEIEQEELDDNKNVNIEEATVAETQTEAVDQPTDTQPPAENQVAEPVYAAAAEVATEAPAAAETGAATTESQTRAEQTVEITKKLYEKSQVKEPKPTITREAPKPAALKKPEQEKIAVPRAVKPELTKKTMAMPAKTKSPDKLKPAPIKSETKKSHQEELESPKMPEAAKKLIEVVTLKPKPETSSRAEVEFIQELGKTEPEVASDDYEPLAETIEPVEMEQPEISLVNEVQKEEQEIVALSEPEAEIAIDHPSLEATVVEEPVDLTETELAQPEEEPAERLTALRQIDEPEVIIEPPKPSETELLFGKLVERIETGDEQEVDVINSALDKIAELTTQLDKNEIVDEEANEQAAITYCELFDELGIECEPETVESLAKLSLKSAAKQPIRNKETEKDLAVQGSGTHEIIILLSAALSDIKEAWDNVWAIGKSALEGCQLKQAA